MTSKIFVCLFATVGLIQLTQAVPDHFETLEELMAEVFKQGDEMKHNLLLGLDELYKESAKQISENKHKIDELTAKMKTCPLEVSKYLRDFQKTDAVSECNIISQLEKMRNLKTVDSTIEEARNFCKTKAQNNTNFNPSDCFKMEMDEVQKKFGNLQEKAKSSMEEVNKMSKKCMDKFNKELEVLKGKLEKSCKI